MNHSIQIPHYVPVTRSLVNTKTSLPPLCSVKAETSQIMIMVTQHTRYKWQTTQNEEVTFSRCETPRTHRAICPDPDKDSRENMMGPITDRFVLVPGTHYYWFLFTVMNFPKAQDSCVCAGLAEENVDHFEGSCVEHQFRQIKIAKTNTKEQRWEKRCS